MRRIRKGDLVQVISGKYKGAKGRIQVVMSDEGKVIVDTLEGIVRNEHPWIREYFHGARGRLIDMEAGGGA